MALRFTGGAVYTYAGINFISSVAYTFAGRMKLNGANTPLDLMYPSVGGAANDASWLGYTNAPDGLTGYDQLGGSPVNDWSSATPGTTWHHLCETYDGTTIRIYVDGVEIDSAVADLSARPNYDYCDTGYGDDFSVQDVAWWNRALDATEVAGINDYRITSAMDSGLYLLVPMVFGAADPYEDIGGGGHDLQPGAADVADDPDTPLSPPAPPLPAASGSSVPRFAPGRRSFGRR